MNKNNKNHTILLGSALAILTALSISLMGVYTKKIGTTLPTSMLLFVRFLISFVAILPIIIKAKNFTCKVHHRAHLGLRVTCGLLSIFFLLYSIKYIPLVDALLLNNTASLFIPIFAFIILKAKTPLKAISGLIVGFVGVILVLHPGKEILSLASILALLSGIFAAIAIVEMRILSKKDAALQMLFYYYGAGLITGAIYAAFEWKLPTTSDLWLDLILVGVFGTLYQFFATLTYKTAPVRLMSPLLFAAVIFGGLFDWLFWGIVPDALTYIGGSLIVLGSVITICLGRKSIIKS